MSNIKLDIRFAENKSDMNLAFRESPTFLKSGKNFQPCMSIVEDLYPERIVDGQ